MTKNYRYPSVHIFDNIIIEKYKTNLIPRNTFEKFASF